MANPLAKSRNQENPYAIFNANGWEWRILKTYKLPENEDDFARWFVAAKSDMSYGMFELGDTYKKDILKYGTLTWASPEFQKAYPDINLPKTGGG